MADFGNTLGNSMSDQNSMNSELSLGGEEDITILDLHTDELDIWNARIIETQIPIGSSFILGHSTNGVLAGTGLLGDYSGTPTTLCIRSAHDIFPEHFMNNRFIDSGNSTGSIDNTNGVYYF